MEWITSEWITFMILQLNFAIKTEFSGVHMYVLRRYLLVRDFNAQGRDRRGHTRSWDHRLLHDLGLILKVTQ